MTSSWNFHPVRERIAAAGMTATGVVVGFAGLSQIFNPVAMAGIAAVTSFILAVGRIKTPGTDRVQSHDLPGIPADNAAAIDDITTRSSALMGMKIRPWVRLQTTKHAAMAEGDLGRIILDPAYVDKPRQRDFLIAHEVSHLANGDSFSVANIAYTGGNVARKLAAIYGMAELALTPLGVTMPSLVNFDLGMADAILAGTSATVGYLAVTQAMKIDEYRADRNAVYVLQNDEGAKEFFYSCPRRSTLAQAFNPHPSQQERLKAIDTVMTTIRHLPPPALAPEMAGQITGQLQRGRFPA